MSVLVLFILGAVLLGAEIFLPGGIVGVIGALLMGVGCTLTFVQSGPAAGLWSVAGAAAVLAVVLAIEFLVLPRTPYGKRLFLQASVSGTSQPAASTNLPLVGREALCLTPLSPSGVIEVEGQRREAYSESGYLAAGTKVRIVAVDTFRLIVTQTS